MLGPIKTVGIYVEDQERSIDFYTGKLEFQIRRSMPMGPQARWIEVAPPGAQTALVLYPRSMMTNWADLKPSIVFHCEDVLETCEKLEKKGVQVRMQPTPMPWGTFAIIVDPDGNELGMTSQEIAPALADD